MPDLGVTPLFYAAAIPAVVLLGLSKGGFSGVVLLAGVFAARQLLSPDPSRVAPSGHNRPLGLLCGALFGVSSMVANAGSPPFQIYVLPQRLNPPILAGTSSATNLTKVAPFAALEQFDPINLVISATLMPVAILSNLAGIHLVRRISAERFYRAIYLILTAVSVKLVCDGLLA